MVPLKGCLLSLQGIIFWVCSYKAQKNIKSNMFILVLRGGRSRKGTITLNPQP